MAISRPIAAYRLAVVRDAPGRFQIRLGNWVEIDPKNRIKSSHFSDDQLSVAANQLLPFPVTALGQDEQSVNEHSGVAVFIAEVRYADGSIWRQNMSRNELLWAD